MTVNNSKLFNMDFNELDFQLSDRGWFILENAVDPKYYIPMRDDLFKVYEICREIQIKNGIDNVTYGTSHHIINQSPCYLEYLENLPLRDYFTHYFGGPFILNSFGAVIVEQKQESYADKVHRDIRTFSGTYPMMINSLVMLDDFTEENGATYLMSGSHLCEEKPSNDVFYAKAERATGKAGSLLVFNSNLWHAAGVNQTDKPRRAVTPTYSKPFFKQQMDYSRLLGYDRLEKMSENLRQMIGYYSRVPSSLDEWYQLPENRFYRREQG
jgi:hypothetical protein